MPFVSHLRSEQIAIAPGWQGFGATVDGLLERLCAAGLLSVAICTDAGRAIRARETEASTAMLEIGVGVPHARIAGLDATLTVQGQAPVLVHWGKEKTQTWLMTRLEAPKQ